MPAHVFLQQLAMFELSTAQTTDIHRRVDVMLGNLVVTQSVELTEVLSAFIAPERLLSRVHAHMTNQHLLCAHPSTDATHLVLLLASVCSDVRCETTDGLVADAARLQQTRWWTFSNIVLYFQMGKELTIVTNCSIADMAHIRRIWCGHVILHVSRKTAFAPEFLVAHFACYYQILSRIWF